MKKFFSEIPDFIKKFLKMFLIIWIASIINVFTFRIYPPILYSFFWLIYIIWIRNYWLWAFKLEYIKKYIKGYLDLRLMIGFGMTYFFLVPLPLILLSFILPMIVWALFHDFINRDYFPVFDIVDFLAMWSIRAILLLLVAGIIMKIIKKLNINVGNINKDKFDKRFEKINQLLKDKIITQEEYEKLRKKIIEDI